MTAQEEAPAAAPVNAQPAPLPEGARFDQPVSFRTSAEGEALDAMLQALARSVGLTAITQGVPDTTIRYDIGEPKPFREVWEIVLTLNGLEYVLRDPDIVVVGPPNVIAGLEPRQQAAQAAPTIVRTYRTQVPSADEASSEEDGGLAQLANYVKSQFPQGNNITILVFNQLGLLSVRATEAQQEQIAQLLAPFLTESIVRVRRIYPLSYARAEEIAPILRAEIPAVEATPDTTTTNSNSTTADSEFNRTATTTFTPGTPAQPAVSGGFTEGEEVVATPDPRTNRVIVVATERVQAEVASIIAELDQPERQVNIQVRIQEVRTDMAERLGIDLSAGIDRFAATLFSGDSTSGLSFIFDAQRAISGFNIGAILDVFESQGLSRRVDDSNLTVLNNGTATLQSGGTVYISIAGGTDNIERTIPYGVQLDLTPQIANNNEVILDVNGRVEAILSETNDPAFLELSTRGITSRVTLAPGQTVVLGGLLQNQLTDTTRSVPGLGSVPVIGGLFSSNSATETTTELLVIVTANVLE